MSGKRGENRTLGGVGGYLGNCICKDSLAGGEGMAELHLGELLSANTACPQESETDPGDLLI